MTGPRPRLLRRGKGVSHPEAWEEEEDGEEAGGATGATGGGGKGTTSGESEGDSLTSAYASR